MSAGDQIQTTKKKAPNKDAAKSEVEYAGYLSRTFSSPFRWPPPWATTMRTTPTIPITSTRPTAASWAPTALWAATTTLPMVMVLFMMLNTQDTNVAEHKQFMEQAVAANKNSKWRIVTLHQDIYGSAEHSNEPEITNLRYELTPYFEEYDVDAVLTGHDHAYSRSKMLLGGAQSRAGGGLHRR